MNHLKDVNLGNSFEKLNSLLRNPMELHIIEDGLLKVTENSNSMWMIAIRQGLEKRKLLSVICQIRSDASDNRRMVIEMIGEDLLNKIENFDL